MALDRVKRPISNADLTTNRLEGNEFEPLNQIGAAAAWQSLPPADGTTRRCQLRPGEFEEMAYMSLNTSQTKRQRTRRHTTPRFDNLGIKPLLSMSGQRTFDNLTA